ncbi:GDP-L-fucose synthase [Alphaproteobacteria bacterium]|nr:GDP-L-fucose synthase [Alphaproteobacteria bacterium]
MKKKYSYDLKNKRVWVAGHNGMVGKAILERLKKENCTILSVDKKELDLTNQAKTYNWIKRRAPQVVFLAAAKVGGILANQSNQTDFLYQNLMIQNNVIKSSAECSVEKLIFLGSSCIYPKESIQPIPETEILKSSLEKTNEGYALAKIAGLKLCSYLYKEHKKDFITVMPTNLYGPNDNFNLTTSHVLAALVNKIVTAKLEKKDSIEIWGTGKPRREFLYVKDLADAICFIAKYYSNENAINVGTSEDISIKELAKMISKIVGWKGSFVFNKNMPDGTMLKRLNTLKIKNLGWQAKVDMETGIKQTILGFENSLK